MLTFILRRVLSGIVLVLVITVIAFTLLYLGSGNSRATTRAGSTRSPRGSPRS